MSGDEQQITQPKPDFLKSAAPWAETFSKVVAGIAIALYASGFLTVSIYYSQFGFVGTNPFRPRVLAAGAWFFFFTRSVAWPQPLASISNSKGTICWWGCFPWTLVRHLHIKDATARGAISEKENTNGNQENRKKEQAQASEEAEEARGK